MAAAAVLTLLVVAVLVRTVLAPDPPEVTFSAGGASVATGPSQYCDVKLSDCTADAAATVQLPVPAGTALRVTVPDEVAEAPWHVVFSYRDAGGQQVDARSPVFARQQHDYTLALPGPADRLVTAQVQQFGPAPRIDEQTGEVEFPVRGSWVLNATGA